MSFLYPSFLWALTALAIPVIIHLFNFRRFKVVYFSNVKFLREIKEQTETRNKLKNWLVLICRLLAIAFLVFAFAQPYFKSRQINTAAGKKAISIFIDNSFSMGQVSNGVPLLEQAKEKAREIVQSGNDDDEFQIITQDFEGSQQRLLDKQTALQEISKIQPSPNTQQLNNVILRQRQALQPEEVNSKNLYLISDFQKNFSDLQIDHTDSSMRINLVPMQNANAANLYIDSCWMIQPAQVINQSTKLLVKLVNENSQPVSNGQMTLKINDEVKALSTFNIAPNATQIDTLSFTVTQSGWNKGVVSIVDYPITFDDEYFFTFPVLEHISVMLINNSEPNTYLDAVFQSQPLFVSHDVSVNQLNYNDLSSNQLIVLNGLMQISSGLAEALKQVLQQGNNVLIFPNENADLNSYNNFLGGIHSDILNAFETQNKKVVQINRQSRIFKDVFLQVASNSTLPQSSGNFNLSHLTATTAQSLLEYADGNKMMAAYNVGNGMLFLSAVPLDRSFTDLMINPLFAPMIYNMAIQKSAGSLMSFIIGQNNQASLIVNQASNDEALKLKSDQKEFIPQQRVTGNELNLQFGIENIPSGIYELKDDADSTLASFAFNYNRKESDMKFYSPDELQKEPQAKNFTVVRNVSRDLSHTLTGQNLGIPLWKVSVIFALLFLIMEILLLKLWK